MLHLPDWLSWLGSPAVCVIVGALGVIATIYAIFVGKKNRRLNLQIQSGQQQGPGGTIRNITIKDSTVNFIESNAQTEAKGDEQNG